MKKLNVLNSLKLSLSLLTLLCDSVSLLRVNFCGILFLFIFFVYLYSVYNMNNINNHDALHLFTPQLSLLLTAPTHGGMARLC